MFEVDFQHTSSSPLPPTFDIATGLKVLHDFDAVVRLSPDCRGCKPIPPPKSAKPSKPSKDPLGHDLAAIQYYEVEDDLPFMPKYLWSGGVRYQADFLPVADGCDITVHAPGGFTSTNHWRLLHRDALPPVQEDGTEGGARNLLHAETAGGGWTVQIVSDARCNRTFVAIVKGFLKNSHQQLMVAFTDKITEPVAAAEEQRPALGQRRPTLGRRRSSVF